LPFFNIYFVSQALKNSPVYASLKKKLSKIFQVKNKNCPKRDLHVYLSICEALLCLHAKSVNGIVFNQILRFVVRYLQAALV